MKRVPDVCATFRFSTAGLPELARARAVRYLHERERTVLPAGLEPLEPLEPLSDRPLHVDVIKRTLPGLALVSGTFSGLRHAARPEGLRGMERTISCSASMSGGAAWRNSATGS